MNKKEKPRKFVTNVKLFEDFMKENNLTKTKFAKLCGISVGTVNKLLSGNCDVRMSIVIKLVLFMKVKADDLAILSD